LLFSWLAAQNQCRRPAPIFSFFRMFSKMQTTINLYYYIKEFSFVLFSLFNGGGLGYGLGCGLG
jgi:hypothetical protein